MPRMAAVANIITTSASARGANPILLRFVIPSPRSQILIWTAPCTSELSNTSMHAGGRRPQKLDLIDCRTLSCASPSYKRSTQPVPPLTIGWSIGWQCKERGDGHRGSKPQLDLCRWNVGGLWGEKILRIFFPLLGRLRAKTSKCWADVWTYTFE